MTDINTLRKNLLLAIIALEDLNGLENVLFHQNLHQKNFVN